MTNQQLRQRIAELQAKASAETRLGQAKAYRTQAAYLSKILAKREYDVKSAHVRRAIVGAY